MFLNTTEPPMPFPDEVALRKEAFIRFNDLVPIPNRNPETVKELEDMGIMNLANILGVSSRNDVMVAAAEQRILVESGEDSDFGSEDKYGLEQLLKQDPSGRLARVRQEKIDKKVDEEAGSRSSGSRESSPLLSPEAPHNIPGKGKDRVSQRIPSSVIVSEGPSLLPPRLSPKNTDVDITGSSNSSKARGKKPMIESSKDEAESDSRPSSFEVVVKDALSKPNIFDWRGDSLPDFLELIIPN